MLGIKIQSRPVADDPIFFFRRRPKTRPGRHQQQVLRKGSRSLDPSEPPAASRSTAKKRSISLLSSPLDQGSLLQGAQSSQGAGYFLKRSLDVVLSLAALALFAPLMIGIGLLIYASRGGPILFSQPRIGVHGRPFNILKFRTMRADADEFLSELLARDPIARKDWEARQKLETDPRITWLGKFLRRRSMDELPQLINVLKGEMSLVGPRPIVAGERQRYGRRFRNYIMLRPGVTGLWQVSRRSDTSYARRVAMDVAYSRHVSLGFDLFILLATISAVIAPEASF